MSIDTAAASPIIHITAEVGLIQLAKLKQQQRVLIHAASGGVGLAAIEYAKSAGAIIYATAGTAEKREYLKSKGISFISTSRHSAEFSKEMKEMLKADGANGVDVILNSLTHDNYVKISVDLLNVGG